MRGKITGILRRDVCRLAGIMAGSKPREKKGRFIRSCIQVCLLLMSDIRITISGAKLQKGDPVLQEPDNYFYAACPIIQNARQKRRLLCES